MWSVVVCDGDETEREQILEYVRCFGGKKKREMALTGCADWPELYESLMRSSSPRTVWRG